MPGPKNGKASTNKNAVKQREQRATAKAAKLAEVAEAAKATEATKTAAATAGSGEAEKPSTEQIGVKTPAGAEAQTYHHAECGGTITKGDPACPNCGMPLAWPS